MKRFYLQISRIFLLFILIWGPYSGVEGHHLPQEVDTVVRIAPASATTAVGGVIKVEVWVDNVTDLYGADIQLAFDPNGFEVFGEQITILSDFLQADLIVKQEVDNEAGTIWYAITQLNPAPPVDGSGVLFEFYFRAKAEGEYDLTFISHDLVNYPDVESIPHTIQEASYTVSGSMTLTYIYLPLIVR